MVATLEAPELVFGLCSPIGTKNSKFVNMLIANLSKYNYKSKDFKVTDAMKSVVIKDVELQSSPVELRYDSYIKYANKIRELTGENGALAMLCCSAINAFRQKENKNYLMNQAYIFDQFKRGEEIEVLRRTYGKAFVLISLYSEKQSRINYLSYRISNDHAVTAPTSSHESIAKDLVKRDEAEQGEPHGQRLGDAYALADLFLNLDDMKQCEEILNKFLSLYFGSNLISPSKDEYGMYMAKSAALRSLDLSRQVGAAIFSKNGEIQALGCNEVPKPSGGTYWIGDEPDSRDYVLDGDPNERIKRAILADTVRKLQQTGFIEKEIDTEKFVADVLLEATKKNSPLKGSQLMDLIEFGRIIHAEMCAITDAARLGVSIKDSTLYCTTFPCHMCAKHIVSSGIERVLYIEPYPKSYAEQLHGDALEIYAGSKKSIKVQFAPFIGISPLRFRELFERGRRKDVGNAVSEWSNGKPRPLVDFTIATYLASETATRAILDEKLKSLKKEGVILEIK